MLQNDFVFYIDIVGSSSLPEKSIKQINDDIYTAIENQVSDLVEPNNDDQSSYINFTGDGFVGVFKANNDKNVSIFLDICKNIYMEKLSNNAKIRLAATYGKNEWGTLEYDKEKKTPYGNAIVECSRLLGAAEENNLVFSESLVDHAGGRESIKRKFPGIELELYEIKTKDVDDNGTRKVVKAYNLYTINNDLGNYFYGTISSSYKILADILCDDFHKKYRDFLNDLLKNEESFKFKISILLKFDDSRGTSYRALPGRLFMNGVSESKKIHSKMSFPCNIEGDDIKGCPAEAARKGKVHVCMNEERVTLDSGENFSEYVRAFRNVRLDANDIKNMTLYNDKYLPSCFISIPYTCENGLPPLILSIDTEKKIANSHDELELIGIKIQEKFMDYFKMALFGLVQ